MEQFTLTFYFRETKHLKRKDGTYPVQLAIYDKNTITTRYLMTKFGFENKESFSQVIEGRSTTKDGKLLKKEMDTFLNDAEAKATSLKVFSIPEFKELLKRRISIGDTVTVFYNNKITELKEAGRAGTASNYECSLNSLELFRKSQKKGGPFYFQEITTSFLNQYERWMQKEGKSNTTIGIYLRPLRSILNDARSIKKDIPYPFHTKANGGYKIPGSIKTNKALNSNDLKKLFEGTPENEDQEKAKAFFFFSYLSNGMNIKDISLLKYKDFLNDSFRFVRAKTENTTKDRQQIIEVVLMDFHREVIEKYGNDKKREFVFPIINGRMNAEKQRSEIQRFTRYINDHIKKYAEALGVTGEISSNWARHSYATKMMNDNVSLEFIRQSLGHQSIATTQHYLSSFESKEKKKNAESLLNF